MALTQLAGRLGWTGLRWLLARAGWGMLGWPLRASLRSALGGGLASADGLPTTPRRAVRSRPRAGYSAYPYSSAA